MFLNYHRNSDNIDELMKRNKFIILAILFILVILVYSMVWMDYRKRNQTPKEISPDGETWTIMFEEDLPADSPDPINPPDTPQ